MQNRRWTIGDVDFIKYKYSKAPATYIAMILGRTVHAVEQKAKELGLKSLYRINKAKSRPYKERVSSKIIMNTNEKIMAIKFIRMLARAKMHSEDTGERANVKLERLRQAFNAYETIEM